MIARRRGLSWNKDIAAGSRKVDLHRRRIARSSVTPAERRPHEGRSNPRGAIALSGKDIPSSTA
jgi:hypothetical protein